MIFFFFFLKRQSLTTPSVISITQELIRKVESQSPFQTCWLGIRGDSWAPDGLMRAGVKDSSRVTWKTCVLIPTSPPPYMSPLSPVVPGETRSWFLPGLSLGQRKKN